MDEQGTAKQRASAPYVRVILFQLFLYDDCKSAVLDTGHGVTDGIRTSAERVRAERLPVAVYKLGPQELEEMGHFDARSDTSVRERASGGGNGTRCQVSQAERCGRSRSDSSVHRGLCGPASGDSVTTPPETLSVDILSVSLLETSATRHTLSVSSGADGRAQTLS